MSNIKKVLVTGGAGYIGSHAVYELIRAGYEVVVLDNLSTGNKEAIHSQAKFYQGDQKDRKILKQIFTENKIDAVMHFSAKLIVPESVEQPIAYWENNVYGLTVLLDEMKNANIKNIVFSSTAAVYGDLNVDKLSEDLITKPINPYGSSKLACEWLIQGVAQAYNFNYAIFRYFNVAGADASGEIGQSTKGRTLTHLIPVIVEAIQGKRKELTVFGDDYNTFDGSCVRDYIHVTDLVLAHIKGLKYMEKKKSGIFNLGSQTGQSVFGVIREVENLGKKVPYKVGPRREGDPAILIADTTKAEKELNFQTTKSLKEIIKSDLNEGIQEILMQSHINKLIKVSIKQEFLAKRDQYYAQNQLLNLLKIEEIKTQELSSLTVEECFDVLASKVAKLYDIKIAKAKSLVADKLIGSPSYIQQVFYQKDIKTALQWYADLCIFTGYIEAKNMQENISFKSKDSHLEVTINVAKPEKTVAQIVKDLNGTKRQYPFSFLSLDNEGYNGNNYANRAEHRMIELKLEQETWLFQYSPYQYFTNHSILIDSQNRSQEINEQTIKIMLAFIDKTQGWFNINSNADIPIVGGSILKHNHFQCGTKNFPIFQAPRQAFHRNIKLVDWPIVTYVVVDHTKAAVLKAANLLIKQWKNLTHQDSTFTFKPDNNAVSISVRKHQGNYEVYIQLRNNSVSTKFPNGNFHVKEPLTIIKKENIGIIEAIGLAIFPGRLAKKNIWNDHTFDLLWIIFKKPQNDQEFQALLFKVFQQILEQCNVYQVSQIKSLYEKAIKENYG